MIRRVLAGIGVATLLLGTVAGCLAVLSAPVGITAPEWAVLAVGVCLLGVVSSWAWRDRRRDHSTDDRRDAVETVRPDGSRPLDIDRLLAAIEDDAESPHERRRSRAALRRRVRETALAVVADDESLPRSEAQRVVATGEWTDRPRAAAYAGHDGIAPRPSLTVRVADWLSGDPTRRRVASTASAIADRAGVDADTTAIAPPTATGLPLRDLRSRLGLNGGTDDPDRTPETDADRSPLSVLDADRRDGDRWSEGGETTSGRSRAVVDGPVESDDSGTHRDEVVREVDG
ncbi:hypothetical protein BRD17_00550 [Halobacteriales archaeon SW_7_68_16]|nr:MAG: hypothetical protein BRD17_00550 [Halobacteriales archaeon SW_7_68_16]